TARAQVSKVKRPADVMLFMDGNPRNLPAGDRWLTLADGRELITLADYYHGPPGWTSFDFKRHRNRANVVFCDGHAETVRLPDPKRGAGDAKNNGDLARIGLTKWARDRIVDY